MSVLLVEDNPGDARLIREYLAMSSSPFALDQVTSIAEALRSIQAGHYDAILLDVALPDSRQLDGFERIRQEAKETAIILLTGLANEQLTIDSLQSGAQDYLNKDQITPELLCRCIRHSVERSELVNAERQSRRLVEATIDSLAAHIAVLDGKGNIIAVNRAWRLFAEDNGLGLNRCGIGTNYLTACENVSGPDAETAIRIARAIRKAMEGIDPLETIEYPCHSSSEQRWFAARVTPLRDMNAPGVVVAHENVTERKLAADALKEQALLGEFLKDVSLGLTLGTDLRTMLQRCAEAVVKHLGAAFARIWLLNAEQNVLELHASAGLYTHIDGGHARVPVGKLKIGLIAQERHPHLTNDVLNDPRLSDIEWARREGMVAFAGHPLIVDGGVVGVLALFARRPLSPGVLDVLGSVSHGIALGIRRMESEARLRAERNLFENVINNIPYHVYWKDAAGVYRGCNSMFARAMGLREPSEIVGKTDSELAGAADLPDGRRPGDQEILDSGKALLDVEITRRMADGRTATFSTNRVPLRLPDGTISGILGIEADITERKKQQERLHLQSAALRAASNAIMVTDRDGRIIWVNPAVKSLTGYDESEVIGCNPRIFKSGRHNDAFYKSMWATLLRDEVWNGELFNRRKDGSIYNEQMTVAPVRDGSSGKITHFVAIKRDITHERNLEHQLMRAEKLSSIGQLAAGIAHEINTPTQFVGDNTRFLQDGFKDLLQVLNMLDEVMRACKAEEKKASRELLDKLEAAIKAADMDFLREEIPRAIEQSLEGVERVATIVRAMKDFSHPGQQGKTMTDLNKAILSTITVARNEWKYVAEMVTNLDNSLPPMPCCVNELNQSILNMIINAAHAIADVVNKGERGKGTITISTRRLDDTVEIRIQDTGTGIKPEHHQRIFDPFFTTKAVGKGTGQGLSIAYDTIVNKHRGSVEFETEPGKGTTFIIKLPLRDQESVPDGHAASNARSVAQR